MTTTDEPIKVSEAQLKAWGEAFDKGEKVTPLFNGVYTIENTKTGEHRTFKIKTQPDNAGFAPGKRIVALLTSADNTDDDSYRAFGFVEDKGIKVWSSRRRVRKPGEVDKMTEWEKFALILWSLGTQGKKSKFYTMGLRIHEACTCIRCNRQLTTPESVKSGIGPICAGRKEQREKVNRRSVRRKRWA